MPSSHLRRGLKAERGQCEDTLSHKPSRAEAVSQPSRGLPLKVAGRSPPTAEGPGSPCVHPGQRGD